LFSLFYQAHSDLAQALDSNSNPHQALAPKDFLSACLYPFHHPKGSHRRGITASSFLNRGSYSAGGHEFYLSYIFGVDFRFLSNAKSRDLFGKGVQGNPLPERDGKRAWGLSGRASSSLSQKALVRMHQVVLSFTESPSFGGKLENIHEVTCSKLRSRRV
jgi:hypothetical protein